MTLGLMRIASPARLRGFQAFDTPIREFYIDVMRILISISLLLLFAIPAAAAGNNYYIGPQDGVDLRLAPRNKAAVSGHLSYKTEVAIINRERNWTKIQTLGHNAIKGWVPAGAIRKSSRPTSSRSSSSSFFSSFTSMFRSSDPEQKTAVLGVRGLEGGDGKAADSKAGAKSVQIVEWMDTLNVPENEVASFIKEGHLKP